MKNSEKPPPFPGPFYLYLHMSSIYKKNEAVFTAAKDCGLLKHVNTKEYDEAGALVVTKEGHKVFATVLDHLAKENNQYVPIPESEVPPELVIGMLLIDPRTQIPLSSQMHVVIGTKNKDGSCTITHMFSSNKHGKKVSDIQLLALINKSLDPNFEVSGPQKAQYITELKTTLKVKGDLIQTNPTLTHAINTNPSISKAIITQHKDLCNTTACCKEYDGTGLTEDIIGQSVVVTKEALEDLSSPSTPFTSTTSTTSTGTDDSSSSIFLLRLTGDNCPQVLKHIQNHLSKPLSPNKYPTSSEDETPS